jgi:rare lipoprotein A
MGKRYVPLKRVRPGYTEDGIASWYGPKFNGRKTASGEVYNMHDLTAAHKTLPLNSLVSVRNLDNAKNVTVRINDRGPFVGDRIIDLSLAAAKKLELIRDGTGPVRVTVIGKADAVPKSKAGKPTKTVRKKSPNPYYAPDPKRLLTWKQP